AVVVMTDDDKKTLFYKMRSLHKALDETAGQLNQDTRLPDDKVAIFVPARNIETWFRYINSYPSGQECDEITDYEDKTMSKEDKIKLAKRSARILAREICPQGVDAIALPSLRSACSELQRLWL
ncbi:MAG: hypothetical protein ACRC78_06835, partial [Planktothrix sp.]